ncbi:MAG: amidase family protein, partial [Dongiaceae bacterium]
MSDLDLAYTPATELARMIRAREVSPVEVVANSLARIAEVNPRLNCFCFVYGDEAMARAREAERAVMAGKPVGPLHGVPIAIKDLTPTKGKRTTLGSFAYEHWVPDADAPIVEALLGAGA